MSVRAWRERPSTAISPSGGMNEDTMMNTPTFLRNAFDGMVKARQRQARRYARAHLLSLDDNTLARAGLTRDDVRAGVFRAR